MADQALKESFHKDMITLCKRRSKEIKYKSSRLLDIINKYGGYEAAIKHVVTDMNIFEFTLLWEQERLDLSIEALVTKDTYKGLFPDTVFEFCNRRLEEYNYAPKKIEVVEEPDEITDWVDDLFDTPPSKEMLVDTNEQVSTLSSTVDQYKAGARITVKQWKSSFMEDKVFSEKNRDMIIRMYLMGGRDIQAEDIAKEEGYSATYPYEGVTTALGKRLKNAFKLDTPKSDKGKLIWWAILCTGSFISNSEFSLSLRKALRVAIKELIDEGLLDVSGITVRTHKTYSEESLYEESLEELYEEPLEEPLMTQDSKAEHEVNVQAKPKVKSMVSAKENTAIEMLMSKMFEEELPEDNVPNQIVEPAAFKEPVALKEPAALKETIVSETSAETIVPEVSMAPETFIKPITPEEPVAPLATWESLKKACIEYYGAICEICGFDYGYVYGDLFEGFIDIHNLKGEDKPEDLMMLDPHKDLIPVCHNCHAIIHSQNPPYTMNQMKNIMEAAKSR